MCAQWKQQVTLQASWPKCPSDNVSYAEFQRPPSAVLLKMQLLSFPRAIKCSLACRIDIFKSPCEKHCTDPCRSKQKSVPFPSACSTRNLIPPSNRTSPMGQWIIHTSYCLKELIVQQLGLQLSYGREKLCICELTLSRTSFLPWSAIAAPAPMLRAARVARKALLGWAFSLWKGRRSHTKLD